MRAAVNSTPPDIASIDGVPQALVEGVVVLTRIEDPRRVAEGSDSAYPVISSNAGLTYSITTSRSVKRRLACALDCLAELPGTLSTFLTSPAGLSAVGPRCLPLVSSAPYRSRWVEWNRGPSPRPHFGASSRSREVRRGPPARFGSTAGLGRIGTCTSRVSDIASRRSPSESPVARSTACPAPSRRPISEGPRARERQEFQRRLCHVSTSS
ncbi:hypothetical protein C8039_14150 [Halogeometricum sp. wsp3]|nr:hypothetical protein C8039_14150 [Halogeometricum sp. wsp3]